MKENFPFQKEEKRKVPFWKKENSSSSSSFFLVDVWGFECVWICKINFHSEILHGSNFSRPSRCGFGAQLTCECRLNTEIFTPISYFSISATRRALRIHWRVVRSSTMLVREKKKLKVVSVWVAEKRENAKKRNNVQSIIMERQHTAKGCACAMWRDESALAAHRQIARMLHNHRDELGQRKRNRKAFFIPQNERSKKKAFHWRIF